MRHLITIENAINLNISKTIFLKLEVIKYTLKKRT